MLGHENSAMLDHLLSTPIESPEILDFLWAEFMKSGNVAAVLRIVSVLDWEDHVRNHLQSWLREIRPAMWARPLYRDYRKLLIRCCFPIDYDQRSIDGPIDLDLHVALLARNGKLKFAELPISLSTQELMQLAIKSGALWSLLSIAQQNDNVALLCDQESKKPGGAARLHLGNARRTNG
jgi:hypothetical protein